MTESLKQKTISGMIWNGIERCGSSLFLFLSNLILARLLSPDDFGCIGMLLVFISISDAIVDGGFGSALIQKKNPTQADYSTIFYWNIVLSVFLYAILYLLSPSIANFYEIPQLSNVLKVQGVILIINALILIQQNILKKQVAFKKITKINLSAIIAGTGVGILCAYSGYGVWSLVIKSLTTGGLQCLIYWVNNNWRPQWTFSWASFTSLFKFGSFIFLAVIINTLYINLLSLIIGKTFSAATLGYFTQARKLEDVPRSSISSVVTNVSFPIFSQIQDDVVRLTIAIRKCLKSMAFINFPLMLLLIVLAEPLITLLFTSKWYQSIPYFQALCVYGMFASNIELNRGLINALGKSKISFYVMVLQRSLGLILIVIGLYWGMKGMLSGYILSQCLSYIIAAIISGKLMGYGLIKQCRDYLPIFFLSIITAAATYSLPILFPCIHNIWMLCFQLVIYASMYVSLSILFKVEGAEPYYHFLKKIVVR
jgi:O-antigen/teichoic acid export membrane protein